MAHIVPFKALRFNLDRFPDAAALLAPPYDVISDGRRIDLQKSHDRNIVRLDLPRGDGDQKYQNAATELERWIAEGTLRLDPRPALYRYEQTFTFPVQGKTRVRKGFVGMLRLQPVSDRVVLPHEHTLSGPKLDRQKLMRATQAHLSQVFTLYRDPQGEVDAVFAPFEATAPALDTTTPDGIRHRLWVIEDAKAIDRVRALMAPKQVMIADGHHRYETMVSLRDELRAPGAAPGTDPADYGTIFFGRAEDPGLLVLPTHRLVTELDPTLLASLPDRAAPWFEVAPGPELTAEAIERRLLAEGATRVTFALRRPAGPTLWFFLRPDADLDALGPPALRGLDVTTLHGLLLGPLLGIDKEAMAKQAFLSYTHDTSEAVARVVKNEVQGAFLMNATRTEQVLAACEAGFVLPQKSTYFEPKLATGLVMARIRGPGAGL